MVDPNLSNENIDVAEHTEYRDSKVGIGILILFGVLIAAIAYFYYFATIKKKNNEVAPATQRENYNKANFNYTSDKPEEIKPAPVKETNYDPVEPEEVIVEKPDLVFYQESAAGGSLKASTNNGQPSEQNRAQGGVNFDNLQSDGQPLTLQQQVERGTQLAQQFASSTLNTGSDGNANVPSETPGTTTAPSTSTPTIGTRQTAFNATTGYNPRTPTNIPNQSNVITKGATLPAVLDFAIDSSLSGQLRAHTTEHVYSADGRKLLIPKGSELTGQYSGGVIEGDTRVFFLWDRIRLANGIIIDIDGLGIDKIGRSGIGGSVDERFFYKFGAAILVSLLDNNSGNVNLTIGDTALDTGDALDNVLSQIVQRRAQLPPIIRVPQGQKFNIIVQNDLDFSAYL